MAPWGHGRKHGVGALLLAAATLTAGGTLLGVGVPWAATAAATEALNVAAGFGSYAPAANWSSSSSPVTTTFDVTGLVSGGDGSIGSVTVTSQPASGTTSASDDDIVYTPTSSTSGTQSIGFTVCDTANPADCGSSTLTLAPPVDTTVDFNCPSGTSGTITEVVGIAVDAPASVTTGATFSATEAATPLQPPATMTCSNINATVEDISELDAIVPVPRGSSYVSGSAALSGGDPATDAHTVLLVCGSSSTPEAVVPSSGSGTCDAQTGTSNYPSGTSGSGWATTDPYFELVTSGVDDTPQDTVDEPSITASFTATGASGSSIEPELTEVDTDGTASAYGVDESAQVYGAPSTPTPLATTRIGTAPPTVTGINPDQGPVGGGTQVSISGTNLSGATAVDFGSTAATSYTVDSATEITAVSPPSSAGTADVTVTTAGGTSATSAGDEFTWVAAPTVTAVTPTSGPGSGGTSVTVTGTGFSGVTGVDFGSVPAASFSVSSSTSITAVSPPAPTGTVNVTVTTAGGTSATSADDEFTTTSPPPAPTVSAVSPASGSTAGGTMVTVTGTDFTAGVTVDFGSAPATDVTVGSATSVSAVSPAAAAGTVDVTVTSSGGTSATSAADRFTYVASAAPPPPTPPADGSGSSASGTGAGSGSGSTPGTPGSVGVPQAVSVQPADGGALVHWSAPSGPAPAGYMIGLSPGCPACTGLLVPATTTATTIVGLPNDTATTVDVAAVSAAGTIGTPSSPVATVPQPGDGCPTAATGAWLTHWDGTITPDTTAGGPRPTDGSMAGRHLAGAVVGTVLAPGCTGYWQFGADGGVFAFGSAPYLGRADTTAADPTVAMATTPDGRGYWLVDATGTVTTHGDATDLPASSPGPLTGRVVALVPTPDAKGYWIATTTGAVAAHGDATSYGSLVADGIHPDGIVTALTPTSDGHGYWLLTSGGAVYAFGDAPYLGGPNTSSTPGPWVGLVAAPTGGYWTVGASGRATAYGTASAPSSPVTTASPTWTATPL